MRTPVELAQGLAAQVRVHFPRLVLMTFPTQDGGTVMYQAPDGDRLAAAGPALA